MLLHSWMRKSQSEYWTLISSKAHHLPRKSSPWAVAHIRFGNKLQYRNEQYPDLDATSGTEFKEWNPETQISYQTIKEIDKPKD